MQWITTRVTLGRLSPYPVWLQPLLLGKWPMLSIYVKTRALLHRKCKECLVYWLYPRNQQAFLHEQFHPAVCDMGAPETCDPRPNQKLVHSGNPWTQLASRREVVQDAAYILAWLFEWDALIGLITASFSKATRQIVKKQLELQTHNGWPQGIVALKSL